MVTLLNRICNDLIERGCISQMTTLHSAHCTTARDYVDTTSVFQLSDPPEAMEAIARLEKAVDVCREFKSTYFEYKSKVNASSPERGWR